MSAAAPKQPMSVFNQAAEDRLKELLEKRKRGHRGFCTKSYAKDWRVNVLQTCVRSYSQVGNIGYTGGEEE